MTTVRVKTRPCYVDLTHPPPLGEDSARLARTPVLRDTGRALDSLTTEESPRARERSLAEILRKLDPHDLTELMKAAGRSSLQHDRSGLRFLFTFLDVKRPGVEVLDQVQSLASLERVSLRIVRGSWTEPEESQESSSVFPIIEVLEEATRVGVLDLGIEKLPRRVSAIRALFEHIRIWFGNMKSLLENGAKLPEPLIHHVTQLCMIEISLLEKRVSHLAGSIDPYDVRGMGRLMPVLSRYDQDIEHMKSVVSRLTTYQPFYDRLMTMEHVLSSSEVDKLVQGLKRDPAGRGLARILTAMRAHPILDREFTFLVSLAHQVASLRAEKLGGLPPDLHSTILQVLGSRRDREEVHIRLETPVADELWPTLETWGVLRRAPDSLEIRYREDRALEFIEPDGTPRLPERPAERIASELSLKELVRGQMQNEAFILGLLENPKATQFPGILPLIASQTRSLRVLDRICRTRILYSGTVNKEVPALLLQNPARMPLSHLRRFIHIRFVPRTELLRITRNQTGVRPEVRKEIDSYLRSLKS